MRILRIGTLVAVLVAATACGGGGGSSDGGTVNGNQSTVVATFQADEPSPPANSVALAQGSASGNLVTVRVNVWGVNGVYGGAFDLTYDSSKFDYVSYSAGTLLEQGGNTPNYSVGVPQAGRVVVGASRTGSTSANASGQAIIQVTFRAKVAGSAPVTIENMQLYNSQNPPQPIGGISWFAGTLTGT
jgi:cohesin domain-containing protein